MTDEPTNFLYPFIDAQETDPKSLLADLTASAQAKAAESLTLRRHTLEENAELLHRRQPRWRAASPPVGGYSPSATVAAAPTPPRWQGYSPVHPSGHRCRPGR
ncbi:putative phosphoheptose isomerase [Mycobacterium xenopi 4042]|uniref:Putative phosphoheptose isomerase n=1 Tax=Mycobacterium xenopi 4042 TaxID=1299334 RepID=X7Z5W1_MYCXE|nr:putative phosphoheptose isomerase [Mycobacterium xenopi 4042]